MSLMTWTVPLGKVSTADSRAISETAESTVGKSRAKGAEKCELVSFGVIERAFHVSERTQFCYRERFYPSPPG